jgi:adenylate cyclase
MLLALVFAVLAATYAIVVRFSEANARGHAEANLDLAARVFADATRQQIDFLARSAAVMSGDAGIKDALIQNSDFATLSSTLESYARRVGAPVIGLFKVKPGADPKPTLIANSEPDMANENEHPFEYLIEQAVAADKEQNDGFAYLKQKLHVLVVVPLYAPYPEIAAWFGLAFPVDDSFAAKIRNVSRVDVTFVSIDGPPRVLATTLSAKMAGAAALEAARARTPLQTLDLGGERYLTRFKQQDMLADAPITLVLQRPLSAELTSAKELENFFYLVALGALAIATIVALWLARSVSRPVLTLAEYTRHVAAGDYTRRLSVERADELGQLASAFNAMSVGLAERDRVRDLLDKNVSPEVAAQLLRDGAALGGEERAVTILFADLRGFTTLSEKLAPRDLLALLNRYLDRMSGAIEAHGGVIDKFIGDAIMALFGAPVTQGDPADRALAAALAMERALADLNREFESEGRPPLAIGIGVNTARVVAGNIGSHRRLNYSVIGDGVNVAARLQSLTRTAEYRTNIITSAATLAALRRQSGTGILPVVPATAAPVPNHGQDARATFSIRPLGNVQVKGRTEPVEIFGVEKRLDP